MQTTLCENRKKKSIHSFILTLVHFWHFAGSQIVPAELRRKLRPLSLPEPKENKTSLWCGLFIKCALCICSLGTNKHVNKVPLQYQNPQIDCMTEELNAKWLLLLLVVQLLQRSKFRCSRLKATMLPPADDKQKCKQELRLNVISAFPMMINALKSWNYL